MAATYRAMVKRRFEDRLVDAVECLDCEQPRGRRCRTRDGRERVTCCQARLEFGEPILRAEAEMTFLLVALGYGRDLLP